MKKGLPADQGVLSKQNTASSIASLGLIRRGETFSFLQFLVFDNIPSPALMLLPSRATAITPQLRVERVPHQLAVAFAGPAVVLPRKRGAGEREGQTAHGGLLVHLSPPHIRLAL
jgi:hypothetical protein